MRKIPLLLLAFGLFAFVSAVQAQQLDAAFGINTITAPSNQAITSANFFPQSVGGGFFPSVSADYLWKNHLGAQGEVAWRGKDNVYGGYQPFRPIFYDFNAMYAPYLGKKVELEALAGIGSLSSRFYTPYYNCSAFSCTDYQSSNHLAGHLGAGVRLYVWNRVFVRPEAHFYFIRNNFEYNSEHAERYGVSIGYSFGTSD
ncbi:MAG TPA: hypothetical protein VGL89_06130 [Candidatus Koribacter sp.]|jgi:hypothetical protein